ncbi:FtsK/SpoIIIE domain-containing protein [Streptosporangium jomthongense]|uniref:FtsK/SpoIIIE domain-containing protein n=1 Tax=Streptosporangium jomthongense TaxID=1193683 RepID=A0ABV8F6B8_9ACTN
MASKSSSTSKALERSLSRRVDRQWLSRGLPMAAPWGLAVVLILLIALVHDLWGGDALVTPLVALFMSALGVVVTGYTWIAAGNRPHLRLMATISSALVTLALVVGLIVGFGPMWQVYAMVAFTWCVCWDIRHVMKWANEEKVAAANGLARLGEVVEAEKFSWRKIKATGKGIVKAEVIATAPDATIGEVQDMRERMETAAHLPVGAVTVKRDPGNAARGLVEVMVDDLLAVPVPWPGPHRVGALISDPIPVGIYNHGEAVEVYVTGRTEDVDLEHLLAMGVSGAGKSFFARVLVAGMLVRKKVTVWAIDCKGLQTFGCLAHGLDWLITDYKEARKALHVMANVITVRTNKLAEEGLDRWSKKSSLNFLVVWIEEAADLFASKNAYDEFVRKARSAGIMVVSSLQRATHDNLSTDARANHGSGMCFGVRETADAEFALPSEVVDAGASPSWRASKPGYAYLAGLGTDPDDWARPLRTYLAGKAELAAAVTAAVGVRTPLDETTVLSAGVPYANRTVYDAPIGVETPDPAPRTVATVPPAPAPVVTADPAAERPASPTLRMHAVRTPGGEDEFAVDDGTGDETEMFTDPEDVDLMSMQAEHEISDARRDLEEALAEAENEHLADVDPAERAELRGIGIDTPLPRSEDMELSFGEEETELTPEQAHAVIDRQLHEWIRTGRTTFGVKDLGDLLEALGKSRRWFYHHRDDLMEQGVLAEGAEYGTYDILRSPLEPTDPVAA